MAPTSTRYAQVALPNSLRQTFSYAVDPNLADSLEPGHRVLVPFGRGKAHGYVVGLTETRPDFPQIKSIVQIDPEERLFNPETLELTRWISEYYLAPWGQVLEGALPPNVRKRGSRDRRKKSADPPLDLPPLDDTVPKPDLFPAQRIACETVVEKVAAGGYEAFLLHGVTGSGKTEVYLRIAEQVVARGGQVLFLVPEIAMGAQILSRVRDRFGERVGLYHSQAGDGVRRKVWLQARDGHLPIVVGARSAVFVPMPNLRLIIVDEEHETAYKQDETPRYHGRDVALFRAQRAGAIVVLGSATPSLDSRTNVEKEKYRLLSLPERVDGRPPSRVHIVDMAEVAREESGDDSKTARPPILSPYLKKEIQLRLDRNEQTILFLNRRGHSTTVQCGSCGNAVQCSNCDVVLTYHRDDGRLRCHYCNSGRPDPGSCEACGSEFFFYGGVGTQRVEETLDEFFPQANIARMDRDSTRKRGSHGALVDSMESGEIDILLGTQMVAKGLDFHRVTLVGVLQADQEIFLPDYRAGERGFQILTQVAGRSGRGETPGEVVFQTMMPDHYVIAAAAAQDYDLFANEELSHRQDVGYPPFRRIIHLLVDGPKESQVEARAEAITNSILEKIAEERIPARAVGPAPMPISRLKGQYRWHLCLLSKSRGTLHTLARFALDLKPPRGLSATRIQADVDPMTML